MSTVYINSFLQSTPWYLSGGAPTPIAVYEAKGAASLAASYVNIVNPGTFNAAPGVAPTWAAGTGWAYNGTTQYLTTGIIPATGWSALIRYSGAGASGIVFGARVSTTTRFHIAPRDSGDTRVGYASGGEVSILPNLPSGVLAIAGQTGYRNGVVDTTAIPAWSGTNTTQGIYIGANNNNGALQALWSGNVLYFVIWNTSTDHATWIPAVSAAVAAL